MFETSIFPQFFLSIITLTLPFQPLPHLHFNFPICLALLLFYLYPSFSFLWCIFFSLVDKHKHIHLNKLKKKIFSYYCCYPEHLSLGFLYFPLPFPFLCLYLQTVFQSLIVALPLFFFYHLCYVICYYSSYSSLVLIPSTSHKYLCGRSGSITSYSKR